MCSEQPRDAEVVIIGGGIAGVVTALHLVEARPGLDVMLLDAGRIGFGASGRSAGLLSPLPIWIWLITAARDIDHAWAIEKLNAGIEQEGQWLSSNVPTSECMRAKLVLQSTGRLSSIAIPVVARALRKAGVSHVVRDLNRKHPSIEVPAHTVNPLAMTRAIAAKAAAQGARIHENILVHSFEEFPSHISIRLATGLDVRARTLIVCVNSGAAALGIHTAALTCASYMIAVNPLDAEIANRGINDFVVQMNRDFTYYRWHQGCLLFGGIDDYQPQGPNGVPLWARRRLIRHMTSALPWTQNAELVEAWSGRFHVTRTEIPILFTSRPSSRFVLNVGFGGTGLALALLAGRIVARQVLGIQEPNEDDTRLRRIFETSRAPLAGWLVSVPRLLRRALLR